MADTKVKPKLAGPLYVQVAELLRSRIENLEWRPDMPMPNEALLAKETGVSIGTMRKALEALEAQKYITRRQGRGTFVTDASFEAELARFDSIYRADLLKGGESYGSKCTRRAATGQEQTILKLGAGSDVLEIVRSRRQAGAYATSECIVVPADMLDGLDQIESLADPLLFAIYRRDFHIVVTAAAETIVPWNADAELARQLGIEDGRAVLKISRVARASTGEPVEWSVRFVHIAQSARPAGVNGMILAARGKLERLTLAGDAPSTT